jgi:transcription elongation GreA/GreB family factor
MRTRREVTVMNSTAYKPLITHSGRERIRDEQMRLRQRQAAATERLKQELEDRDDLTWYLTQEELLQIQVRLDELEAALAHESSDPPAPEDGVVGPGSRVIVEDEDGGEHAFVIVAPIETDAARGRISLDSPVGAALLGRHPGESVSVSVPRGERQLTVLRVEAFAGGGV